MLKKSYITIFFIASVTFALPHIAAATTTVRADAPPAVYDDGEVSSVLELMPGVFPTARALRIELLLDDSVTGSGAELRLGKAKGGRMSLAGTATIIGFENGAWFIQGGRHRQRFTAANSATVGVRTLAVRMRLDTDGVPVNVAVKADGKPLTFAGLEGEVLKAWLDPRHLDVFRLVSRGGANGVSATVKVYVDGTLFILR